VISSNEKVYVCGMNKTGKSYWASRLVENMRGVVGVIVYDPNWEHSKLVDNDEDVVTDPGVLAHMEQVPRGSLVLVQPDDDSDTAFDAYCQAIWENQRNVFVMVDEAHDVCPALGDLLPYHKRLIRRGRHFGIGMVHVSQRPAETHKMPLAQAQHVIIFKMHLDNDIQYVASWLQSKELPAMITRLKPYHYVYYDVNAGTIHVNPPV